MVVREANSSATEGSEWNAKWSKPPLRVLDGMVSGG
jgi:hypothetical protein